MSDDDGNIKPEWNVNYGDLEFGQMIGKGNFGKVSAPPSFRLNFFGLGKPGRSGPPSEEVKDLFAQSDEPFVVFSLFLYFYALQRLSHLFPPTRSQVFRGELFGTDVGTFSVTQQIFFHGNYVSFSTNELLHDQTSKKYKRRNQQTNKRKITTNAYTQQPSRSFCRRMMMRRTRNILTERFPC